MCSPNNIDRRLSIAPMMEWTDSLYRRFMRLMTKRTLLYTEMVTSQALIHGDPHRLLAYDNMEHPIALQLGGGDPQLLEQAVKISAPFGYDEINLNVGCPSDRVSAGRFGACLMLDPQLVAACFIAMQNAIDTPITIKHRIGVDERESYEELHNFVATVADAGCQSFTIHARKAWLNGLSPKENREIPPLRYDFVHRIKQDFPHLEININGGIRDLDMVQNQLAEVDGVMIGRAAYETPLIFAEADQKIFGEASSPKPPQEIVEGLADLAAEITNQGIPLPRLTRHVLGLFHACPGAKSWRRAMGEDARDPQYVGTKAADLILRAADNIPDGIRFRIPGAPSEQ
jgi:tRNA-dihydrouridine synthase A